MMWCSLAKFGIKDIWIADLAGDLESIKNSTAILRYVKYLGYTDLL